MLMLILSLLSGVTGIGALITAILLRRVVPTNMVHIVQSAKKTTPYGRGQPSGNTYYDWPQWLPIWGVTVTTFPESIFDVDLPDYDAYDKGRLPFKVSVKAFFRIDKSETAAQRVKDFEELKTQLEAILQGSVRKILAGESLEDIMQDRAKLGQMFTSEVEGQLPEWGVMTVKSIEFMDIRDSHNSSVIANIMAKEKSRIEMESRQRVAQNIQEAETAEVNARREVDMRKQEANQAVGEKTAQAKQAIGVADERSKQQIAQENAITAEKQQAVNQINQVRQAEIAQSVAVVNADAARKVAVTEAEAARQVQVVAAEGEKTSTVTKAEGNLTATIKEAEGIEAKGKAQGAADQAVQMAPVNAQIALAREIGNNEGYQGYLLKIEAIKVTGQVGIAQAEALEEADIKVIANGGSITSGVNSIGDLLNSSGGTNLGAMVSGLLQNPDVAKLAAGLGAKAENVLSVGASVAPKKAA